MKIGIGSYALAWSIGVGGYDTPNPMDIFHFLNFAHEKKVSLVQIADNIPLHLFENQDLFKLKKMATDLQIDIEVGTRGLILRNIERYLEIASFLGSPILRVVIDTTDFQPSIREINKTILYLLPELKRFNIKLAIENHDRLKAKDFRKIVQAADSQMVGICLDSVNSIGADEGFETVFNTLAPYTINLHLKDYIIRRKSHMMGFDIYGAPAGQGMMPIERVLDTLKHYGQTKSVILELWPPPEDSVAETIEKERKWVSDSLKYLNALIP
jgi:sugar phosphate isomerase/epimerase